MSDLLLKNKTNNSLCFVPGPAMDYSSFLLTTKAFFESSIES